jgi:hypothetical protein
MKHLWGSSVKVPSRAVRLKVTVALVMGAMFLAAPTASAGTGRTTAAQVSRTGLISRPSSRTWGNRTRR